MKPLIVIIGPTAVGKTKLSIDLAKELHTEIISGDSMQIYRSMDIGTAKIKQEEMSGIPHHLIDIKEPTDSFSVAEYQALVREKIEEIHSKGKVPIIVGGTGLYIQSVIYDYDFDAREGNSAIREKLEGIANQNGVNTLYEKLLTVDPASAEKIHPNNIRRVIRALEIYESTGKTMTEHEAEQEKILLYNTAIIGLTLDRAVLYERINHRVNIMLQEGLLTEVKALYDSGIRNCQSVQAIGYKELYQYFDGNISLEEAINELKQNSRRYAKRQLTWFRNKMEVAWFEMNLEKEHEIYQEIFQYIAGKLSLESNK